MTSDTDLEALKAWLRNDADDCDRMADILNAGGCMQKMSVWPKQLEALKIRKWADAIEALQRELANARDLPSIAYMAAREDSAKEIAGLKAERDDLQAENAALREVYEAADHTRNGPDWRNDLAEAVERVREREAKK